MEDHNKLLDPGRDTLKLVLSLGVPIGFQSLIQSSLSIIDQIMVARLGGEAMASAGIALRPLTILFFMFLAITGALGIFVAQYWGDRQYHKIRSVLTIALKYGLMALIPVMSISLFAPKWVIGFFSTDLLVIANGANYLRILSVSFIPLMMIMILTATLKSCGMVKIPVLAGVIAVISNTILNMVFIYGLLDFKGYGLEGAAIATVIARLIEAAFIMYGVYKLGILKRKSETKLEKSELDALKISFRKVSYPLIVSEAIFIISITFYAVLYGRMGTNQMAAMTVLFPLQNVAFGLFAGLSTAGSTLIGQSLGRGDFERARFLAQRIMVYTLILSSGLASVFAVILPTYLSIFKLNNSIYSESYSLIMVAMLILPFQLMNMVIYEGVLRTGGETAFLVKIQLATLWALGIPAGIVTAFIFKLPLPVVFLAVSFEEIVRLSISYMKMRQGTWIARLTG